MEQTRIKWQLVWIENKNLDRSLIFRGVNEEYKEMEQQICRKIHSLLSVLMQGETTDEKLEYAKKILIRNCRCLVRFNRNRVWPLSVEFVHKHDVEFILENRMDLEKGVYVNRKYPFEIEWKRKMLLPVLRATRRLEDYKNRVGWTMIE